VDTRLTSFDIQTKTADELARESVVAEIRGLLDRFQSLEAMMEGKSQVVRHVRTPEGVDQYGQPIGSVIVADTADGTFSRLGFIFALGERDKNGIQVYQAADDDPDKPAGASPRLYYVHKDKTGKFTLYSEKGGKRSAVKDLNGDIIQGKNELDVLERFNEHVALHATKKRGVLYMKKPEDRYVGVRNTDRFPVHGNRPVPPGMHLASYAELEYYGSTTIPNVDVFMWDDDQLGPNDVYAGVGVTRQDIQQPQLFKLRTGAAKKDKKKVETVKAMKPKMPAFESKVRKDIQSSDDATADTARVCMLLRNIGIRIQSSDSDVTFGGRTLEARHIVKNTPTSMEIRFSAKNSKKGQPATDVWMALDASDPRDKEVIDMLRGAVAGKKGRDRLFPATSERAINTYIPEFFGDPNATAHKLRSFRATEEALKEVYRILADEPPAKTKTEFMRQVDEVRAKVAGDVLFDTNTSLVFNNYVDPSVLAPLGKANPAWIKEMTAKRVGGREKMQ